MDRILKLVLKIGIESIKILLFIYKEDKKRINKKKCGKGDLNSRTPTRMGSKPTAYSRSLNKTFSTFDHTWQFPHSNFK